MNIHQWQLLYIDFGNYFDEFDINKNYKLENFQKGINLGREFSEPHLGIVISPSPLCKGDTFLIVPITNYTLNDEKHWDKIVIEHYNFLHKKSAIHLSAIRGISKIRVKKVIREYIPKSLQKQIKNKLCSFFP